MVVAVNTLQKVGTGIINNLINVSDLWLACLFDNAYLWYNIFDLWKFVIYVQSILSLNIADFLIINLYVVDVLN